MTPVVTLGSELASTKPAGLPMAMASLPSTRLSGVTQRGNGQVAGVYPDHGQVVRLIIANPPGGGTSCPSRIDDRDACSRPRSRGRW